MSKENIYSEIVCLIQDNLVEAAAQGASFSILIELLSLLTPVLRQEALVMAAVTDSDMAVKNLVFVMDRSDILAALGPIMFIPEYEEAALSIMENLSILIALQILAAQIFIYTVLNDPTSEQGDEGKEVVGESEELGYYD